MRLAICLRGHERGSFGDERLAMFIHHLFARYETCVLFIHTWEDNEAAVSWKPLPDPSHKIDESMVLGYFHRTPPHWVLIEKDPPGEVQGNVGGSPRKAWENYWHGMFTVVDMARVSGIPFDRVLSVRMDFWDTCRDLGITMDRIYDMIERPQQDVVLAFDDMQCCCDNVIAGTLEAVWRLCSIFHLHLDEVLGCYGNIHHHQEFYVHLVAKQENHPWLHDDMWERVDPE